MNSKSANFGPLLPVEAFYFPSQAQSNPYNLTVFRSDRSTSDCIQYDLIVAYYRPASPTGSNKTPVRVFTEITNFLNEELANRNESSSRGSSNTSPDSSPPILIPAGSERTDRIFSELSRKSTLEMFPELATLRRTTTTTTILNMDFAILSNNDSRTRLAAFGAQDGWFCVTRTDMLQQTVLQRLEFTHESAITHVKLFSAQTHGQDMSGKSHLSGLTDPDDANLLVCSAFESAVVYHDIFKLSKMDVTNQLVLPQSADFDHVNCASVGDFDFDGQAELVLGTFGQRLLFYRWDPTVTDDSGGGTCSERKGSYVLIRQQALIGPALGLSAPIDLVGDGLKCLVILTSRGLHIYRHVMGTTDLCDLIEQRLNAIEVPR